MSARLSDAEREALDKRIAADLWGYYLHFEATGNPEVDRVLSAVGLAAKAYHSTEDWGYELDYGFGPIPQGQTYADFIQRAASDAAARLAEAGQAAEQRPAEVEAERDEAVRQMVAQVTAARSYVEEANTELADLRARIEALADGIKAGTADFMAGFDRAGEGISTRMSGETAAMVVMVRSEMESHVRALLDRAAELAAAAAPDPETPLEIP